MTLSDGRRVVRSTEGGLAKSELDRGSGPAPVAEGGPKNRRDPKTGVKIRYGPYWKFASYRPCVVCGTLDGAPADHWVPVGRGGRIPETASPSALTTTIATTWAKRRGRRSTTWTWKRSCGRHGGSSDP